MGLDQFAYVTDDERCTGAFEVPDNIHQHSLAQWRKHPDLHGWMRELFRSKGGSVPPTDEGHTFMGEDFNAGHGVELTSTDLDALEQAINTRSLPKTMGFFFGESFIEDEIEHDLRFVANARDAVTQGYRVYYTSWW